MAPQVHWGRSGRRDQEYVALPFVCGKMFALIGGYGKSMWVLIRSVEIFILLITSFMGCCVSVVLCVCYCCVCGKMNRRDFFVAM